MKYLLLLLLITGQTWAKKQSKCAIIDGFYPNSPNSLRELKFETVVDIFTINNAKTLSFVLDGETIRLQRLELNVDRHTKMTYTKRKGKLTRAAHVMIDREPRKAFRDKEFLGNILITPEMEDAENFMKILRREDILTYNFRCKF